MLPFQDHVCRTPESLEKENADLPQINDKHQFKLYQLHKWMSVNRSSKPYLCFQLPFHVVVSLPQIQSLPCLSD